MWLFWGMRIGSESLLVCLVPGICQKSKKLGIADIYREELELCNRVESSPEKPHTSFSNRESSTVESESFQFIETFTTLEFPPRHSPYAAGSRDPRHSTHHTWLR
jgi:hypothetical protein